MLILLRDLASRVGSQGMKVLSILPKRGTRARRCRSLNEKVAMNPRVALFSFLFSNFVEMVAQNLPQNVVDDEVCKVKSRR